MRGWGEGTQRPQNVSQKRIGRMTNIVERAGSWFRFKALEKLPHDLLEVGETRRTIGMRERKLGRTHAVGQEIVLLTDPPVELKGRFCLV